MKKIFPLIVILITLSVLGIIFIQMSWINNAIRLRKQQHDQEINYAINNIKETLYSRYIQKTNQTILDEESKQFALQRFSTFFFTGSEVQQIIDRSLKKYGVKEAFEFMVTDIFKNPLMVSKGFNQTFLSSTINTPLTLENGVFKETLYLYINEDKNYIIKQMGWIIAASIFFTTIIISAFSLTVRTMFTQKKLSEIKSDFINNMTHELKTPLATISLAIDALTNEKVIHDSDKIKYYSSMIKEENKRMNKQVEKILQAARIERQEIKLNLQELNAEDIIRKVADNLALQIQDKSGVLNLNLHANRHVINADEVHFSNIVFNLLDNAIKYSKDKPVIEVETVIQNGMLAIKVKDNGIGMSKETQHRVFEKFYRAHTGNLHDVKGFGLGLSYVKAMMEAHGGKVNVDSVLGKGTTFTVLFPLI